MVAIGDRYEGLSKREKREKMRTEKRAISKRFQKAKDGADIISSDPDFRELRQKYAEELELRFKSAFEAYIEGNWNEAKTMLKECLVLDRRDGPTLALLEYLESENFVKPMDWEGFRVLTEK